jgi:hypothetical protein
VSFLAVRSLTPEYAPARARLASRLAVDAAASSVTCVTFLIVRCCIAATTSSPLACVVG